ncbi:MAG TPA: hypothetical protein VMJ92_04635 [Candidatus Limnocylindrales bacterium]|nr:hypothetical protein [Candidatus Limnocylindrales bacterium]
MRRAGGFVPFWAVQALIGLLLVLLAVGLFAALLGAVASGPAQLFDDIGRTVARIAPQPEADVGTAEQLEVVIAAMPEGKLRVGSIVEEHDRVVFTVTAERSAVRAAVRPGDELRVGRDGEVEIVPTGIPGLLDRLERALEELRERYFGQ